MSFYSFAINVPEQSYDAFVKAHPLGNLLQSYRWASIKDTWDHIHTGLYDKDGILKAAALVLIKPLPMGFTMFYIPRGPVMDYQDEEVMKAYFDGLKSEARSRNCLFIKFDPLIEINRYKSKDYNTNRYPQTEEILAALKRCGARHNGFKMRIDDAIQPRFISMVPYTEDIEASLPKHTNRLIKDADRREVKILHGGKEYCEEFARLVELTEQRKNVALRNREYFEQLLDTYGEDGVIFLAVCNLGKLYKDALNRKSTVMTDYLNTPENAVKKKRRLQDQLGAADKDIEEFSAIMKEFPDHTDEIAIAGILSVQYGNTCEMLYAGMDERFKKFMPQYKEYVENFRWAFERGCRYADMGGVEGTLDDGLTRFKDNFNPVISELIGEFTLPVNRLLWLPALAAYEYRRRKILASIGNAD